MCELDFLKFGCCIGDLSELDDDVHVLMHLTLDASVHISCDVNVMRNTGLCSTLVVGVVNSVLMPRCLSKVSFSDVRRSLV